MHHLLTSRDHNVLQEGQIKNTQVLVLNWMRLYKYYVYFKKNPIHFFGFMWTGGLTLVSWSEDSFIFTLTEYKA